MKTFTYPKSTVIKKDNVTVLRVITQLYKTGIYVAVYEGDSISRQLSLTPGQAVNYMKQFEQDNLQPGYTSEFNENIRVAEIDGLWEDVSLFEEKLKTKTNE